MDRPPLFIHSSVDGHLGCFHLLAIVKSVATNMGVQITVRVPAFNSFGYILRSGIAGSYSNSMFNFLKSHHTVFCTGSSILFYLILSLGAKGWVIHIQKGEMVFLRHSADWGSWHHLPYAPFLPIGHVALGKPLSQTLICSFLKKDV